MNDQKANEVRKFKNAINTAKQEFSHESRALEQQVVQIREEQMKSLYINEKLTKLREIVAAKSELNESSRHEIRCI